MSMIDGWIEWKGGECPLFPPTQRVEYRLRSGEVDTCPASLLDWGHGDHGRLHSSDEIIAYRLAAVSDAES